MKYALASLVVSMVFSAQAFAGASNIDLQCKSADGKIELAGNVPGDIAEFELTSTIKGSPFPTLDLYDRTNQKTGDNERNGQITAVQDLKNGVFLIEATDVMPNPNILLRVYAIPKTVNYKKGKNGAWDATFTGQMTISSENDYEDVKATCKLHYSI